MINYRTPESVKKKIDQMLRKGEVVLDYGISCYKCTRYEYEQPSYKNGFESKLTLYYQDFDGKEKIYMELTVNNLRKAHKDDWGVTLIHCGWDKEFPTLLEVWDYDVGR